MNGDEDTETTAKIVTQAYLLDLTFRVHPSDQRPDVEYAYAWGPDGDELVKRTTRRADDSAPVYAVATLSDHERPGNGVGAEEFAQQYAPGAVWERLQVSRVAPR